MCITFCWYLFSQSNRTDFQFGDSEKTSRINTTWYLNLLTKIFKFINKNSGNSLK